MKDLPLVIAAGLCSLGGVLLGALLTPLTQLYLERKRVQRVRLIAQSYSSQENCYTHN